MIPLTVRLLVAILVISFSVNAQTISVNNPLLDDSNTSLPFNKLTVAIVEQAVSDIMVQSDDQIKKITSIPVGRQTLSNTLMEFDKLGYSILNLSLKLGLIQATFTDNGVRNSATNANNKLRLYSSNIFLNEPLYKALVNYRKGKGANGLNESQNKFLNESIDEFEREGMKLPAEKRKELESVNKKIIELGSQFDKNIAESKDSVFFSGEQLKGVPQAELNSWKQPDGKFIVYVNGPNYITITEYAESSDTRKLFHKHYNNRAYPGNITVLDSLLYYRNMYANKLGFKTYAEYALVNKMARKPSNVWAFQDDLLKKLTPRAIEEIKVMRDLKHQYQPEENDSLYVWDINFYTRKLKDTKYNLNTDELKEYFEINNTLKGMFSVYEKLFNISIRQTKGTPVWHEKVMTFDIFNEGRNAGTFYLDLYPRENKYTHFACFGITQYRKSDGKEVLPAASLVCNFPEGASGQPSLLTHRDVITMFHEFGHLVHIMLARPAISSQGLYNIKADFIEAPSQFLENWCWEYSSLKMLAKHYKTGEVLPKTLFDKMKNAQNVNIASFYIRQLYYGYIDMTFEDRYNEVKKVGLNETARKLHSIQHLPYPDGTFFIANFDHLNNYAANYYGYLWSRVFAQDMFSVFERNGVMDTKTGIRYKNLVLQKGSSVPEINIVRSFLGREPDSKAFLKSLGL